MSDWRVLLLSTTSFLIILIIPRVPDETGFPVLGGGPFAHLGTTGGITITTPEIFLSGRARPRRRKITALGHMLTAHASSRGMDLPVWAEQRLLPGGLTEYPARAQQGHGLRQQLVEFLDGDGHLAVARGHRDIFFLTTGMLSQHGQEIS